MNETIHAAYLINRNTKLWYTNTQHTITYRKKNRETNKRTTRNIYVYISSHLKLVLIHILVLGLRSLCAHSGTQFSLVQFCVLFFLLFGPETFSISCSKFDSAFAFDTWTSRTRTHATPISTNHSAIHSRATRPPKKKLLPKYNAIIKTCIKLFALRCYSSGSGEKCAAKIHCYIYV